MSDRISVIDKYAQLRESLKNGEFDFGAECCGNGVWDTPDNPPECCGQPITYTEIIQSLLDERDAFKEALEMISDMYSYDMSLGEASLSLYEASNIAREVLKRV